MGPESVGLERHIGQRNGSMSLPKTPLRYLIQRSPALLGALLLLSAAPASAAVRYISPSGSGSNAGTSPSAPWDLSRANSSLVAGDICYVLPGSYSGSISPANSGSSGARITIIGNISNPAAQSFSGALTLINKHHITIKGVKVAGSFTVSSSDGSLSSRSSEDSVLFSHSDGGLYVSAVRSHIHNSRIGDGNGSDQWLMLSPNGGGTALASDCTFRNNTINVRTDLASSHAIRFDDIWNCEFTNNKVTATVGAGASDSHARKFFGVHDCVFRDNKLEVYNYASYSVYTVQRNYVRFNLFERDTIMQAAGSPGALDIRFSTSGNYPGSCGYNTYVNGFYRSKGVIEFQNNVNADKFFGCTFIGQGPALTFEAQSSYAWNDSLVIRHCTFYTTGGKVVDMNNSTNFIVRSNIFYSLASACPGVELPNTSSDSDSNLFFQAGGSASSAVSNGSGCSSVGSGSSWCSSVGSECRSQWGDPRFVNATYASFDPRPGTGSAAVGAQWKDGYVGAVPPGGVITDQTAPAAVGDLRMDQVTDQGGLLAWTAPGDDGNNGRASGFEIRISSSPITDQNFAAAALLGTMPTPDWAGIRQTYVILGRTPGTTYYLAMKSVDESGNWSGLSNVLTLVTNLVDTTSPGQVSDFSTGTEPQ
jgi:hypothetical protein